MGAVAVAGMGQIMNLLMEWILSLVVNWITGLFSFVSSFVSASFFQNEFVDASLDLFYRVGVGVLTLGLIKAIIMQVEGASHGNGFDRSCIFSFIKAYGLLIFCRPIILLMFEGTNTLANTMVSGIQVSVNFTVAGQILTVAPMYTIGLIVTLVCTISVLLQILRQYMVIYIQVLTGYLYIYDVAAGNDQALGEWARDVLSGRITFALQYVCYIYGMSTISSAINNLDVGQLLLSLIFLLSANTIPALLKRWGYTGSTAGGAFGRFMGTAANVGMTVARFAV